MKDQICSFLWKKRKRGRGRKEEKEESKKEIKKKKEKSLAKFSKVKRLHGIVSLDKKIRQFCQLFFRILIFNFWNSKNESLFFRILKIIFQNFEKKIIFGLGL